MRYSRGCTTFALYVVIPGFLGANGLNVDERLRLVRERREEQEKFLGMSTSVMQAQSFNCEYPKMIYKCVNWILLLLCGCSQPLGSRAG